MHSLTRLAAASLVLSLFALPAYAGSPNGSWQSVDGQARVRVSMCGDGTALCARLTGLSGDARTPENLKLLNTYVVEKAARANDHEWLGTLHFDGQTADGHITMVGANSISVSACQMGMCKTLEFRRVGSAAPTIADAAAQLPPRTVGLTMPE